MMPEMGIGVNARWGGPFPHSPGGPRLDRRPRPRCNERTLAEDDDMRPGLISWWASQSPWLRFGVAAAFLLGAGVWLLFGHFWIWGWAIGGVLLLFSLLSFPEDVD